MRVVQVIYKIMNIVMILTCIVLSVLGFTDFGSWYNIITPIVSIGFAVFFLYKQRCEENQFKQSIIIMLSAHLMVVFVVCQMAITFKLQLFVALSIIAITIALVATMLFGFRYIIIKLGIDKTAQED